MTNQIILLFVVFELFAMFPKFSSAEKNTFTPKIPNTGLSGKISDKKTGEPMPGVSINFPDLRTGTFSGSDGIYKINELPQSKVLIRVSMIGYKLISEEIDLSVVSVKNFEMEESAVEINEIIVTGLSKASELLKIPTPVITVSPAQLIQSSATNIIDALSINPGISQITTGSGISKPVIRGLGFNRVLVVKNGIRQEEQQWGDEHGVEIDEYSVNSVEILKGPASLSFGSDAMAGVINLISAPALPEGEISGSLLSNYQTNNGLFGITGNIAGNKKGFIWDIRYSNKLARAYQNKYDGYVFNSGFKENGLSGMLGLNKSWGYSYLYFSTYSLTPGIVEGDRDSVTGMFVKSVAENDTTEGTEVVNNEELTSYDLNTPFQKTYHYEVTLNNNFILGNASLSTVLGWQQNQRQEFGDVFEQNQYGLYFLLNSYNLEARYNLPEVNKYNFSFGTNVMYQTSKNKGTEYLIPDYNLSDIGLFGIINKSFSKLNISGGLRFDLRSMQGKDLYTDSAGVIAGPVDANSIPLFSDFNNNYSGISGSIGAVYQFNENFYSKINLQKGFRGPNIAELSSNGVHEGTFNYIIGVPDLKSENSLQLDYTFGINTLNAAAEADLFYNVIDNYIYLEKLQSISGRDSITDGYSTYKYASGNAHLFGGEFTLDIHPDPFDWLHFENTFSYVQSVQTNQPDSTKYLPQTPPARITTVLRADINNFTCNFQNSYFQIGMENYFAQNKFFAAFGTETATPGYTLFNMSFGTDVFINNNNLFSVLMSLNNLTDIAYQSHLSRLKYGDVNEVTGRKGVYNMGRNFNFKLVVPMGF